MLTVSSLRISARSPIFSHLISTTLPKTPKSYSPLTSPKRFSFFFFFQKPPMPPRKSPPPSSSATIAVEYAKSNKSTCKKCANAIASKSLRLGIVSPDPRGFDVTKWHHLDCFPIGSTPVGPAEEINGFQELKSSDQEALKELLDRCDESSEKVHERDEDEGNEQEERDSKKAKVDERDEDEGNEPEERDSKKAKVDDPPTSTKIVVEYAKSNKSMCKKCAKAITFKALRLGIVTRDARGFDVTKWHHLDCFPIGSTPVASAEAINGFQELKSSDQEALKELLDRCDESSEKVHERDEDEGNEREERDSKKAKVDERDEDEGNEPEERGSMKAKVDNPPPTSTKIVVEYAKSNKSMCKKCAKAIVFKALRLGIVTRDARGFDVTKWHHLDCFPIGLAPVGSPEAINGFQALKISDQEAVKELLDRCDESSIKLSTSDGEAETEIDIAFSVSDVENKYKDATLLPKWKGFKTIIFLERDDGLHDSNKIAAFDFDGCLAKTSVKRVGADAWSLMYPSIPDKLQNLYNDGYKLVIFTNESNIERWKNKRQAAVDSKIGRLNNFIKLVKVPIQVFIACGLGESSGRAADPFRKPKPGMWHIMEKHFNSGISIDMDQSFYVGDAAGRDNDHSDADIKFAQAVGLKFYVPEEYFGA